MIRHLALGILALFGTAVASPIANNADPQHPTRRDAEYEYAHPAKSFFPLICILCLFAFLAVIKCLYICHSRKQARALIASIAKQPISQCSSAYYDPFSIESYCRSSKSPSLSKLVDGDAHSGSVAREKTGGAEKIADNTVEMGQRSGFLVGFLGSPAWETRLRVEVDIAAWKQRRASMVAYQLHAQSHLTESRLPSDQPSSSGNSQSQEVSSSSALEDNSRVMESSMVRPSRSSSLKLLKHPGRVHDPTPRRRSLPARGWKRSVPIHSDPSEDGKRSRSNSRRAKKRKASKGSADMETNSELSPKVAIEVLPIPTSPTKFAITSSPLFLSNPFPPRFKSKSPKSSPVLVEPQPLPYPTSSTDPFSGAPGAPSTSIPLVPAPVQIQISHPIPLRPKAAGLITEEPINMKGRSRDSRLYMELLPIIRPLSLSTNTSAKNDGHINSLTGQLLPVPRQVLALKNDTNNIAPTSDTGSNNSAALDMHKSQITPIKTSPPLSSVSLFAQKAVFSKHKPRPRQKSRNSQRSVSLGPSPLRSMILPDASSGSDIGIDSPRTKHKENVSPGCNSFDVRSSGFGEFGNLPPSAGARGQLYRHADAHSRSQLHVQFQPQVSPNTHSRSHSPPQAQPQAQNKAQTDYESLRASMNADMASKALLNIVRDLSGSSGSSVGRGNSTRSKESQSSEVRSSKSWDSSREEVDLGLLGLDRFRWKEVSPGGDEERGAEGGDENGKDDSKIDFVSFWEEARVLEEEEERRQSVGLAW